MKKNLLDVVIICDLECTCFPRGEEPPGFLQEIIEIGIALYHPKNGAITKYGGIPIRPRGSISQFCTDLTGWTEARLENAESLENALPALRENLHTDQRVFVSFGDFDRIQLERECAAKGIAYSFGRRHLNVKTLLALREGWSKEEGMAQAFTKLGKEMIGTHHVGADDSFNIARLLKYAIEGRWEEKEW